MNCLSVILLWPVALALQLKHLILHTEQPIRSDFCLFALAVKPQGEMLLKGNSADLPKVT